MAKYFISVGIILLWLLLKVTEVTTELHKWPKISKNGIKSYLFLPEGRIKPSAGARSKPA